jgi:tyrosyl-tRNA synthetase
MSNFLEELDWRGLIHNKTEGVEEHLKSGPVRAYIGFDPTAPSLTIGNYVQIMLLQFLQRAGHQPVVLLGGATGRIGDPSGKDKERELKTYDELDNNTAHQMAQFKQHLDFSSDKPNGALMVNNYDFYANMNVLDFLRDVGKYLTVNYMMAKDSVQKRIESESGISFTEFSYQLIQGYDFVLLNEQHGVTLQMGGSDQFGNITAGVELSRKIKGKKVHAITTPLLTKSDGTKFGKSEKGNIWLDANLTSPYEFYQFWLKADNLDLPKYLRYFSFKSREEIEALEANNSPQDITRVLAEELTRRIHGNDAYESVLKVSKILFDNKADNTSVLALSAADLETISKEIPSVDIKTSDLEQGMNIVDLLEQANILSSRGEAKKAIQGSAISINKIKIQTLEHAVSYADVLHGRYILLDNGKKNKHMLRLV